MSRTTREDLGAAWSSLNEGYRSEGYQIAAAILLVAGALIDITEAVQRPGIVIDPALIEELRTATISDTLKAIERAGGDVPAERAQ